MPGNLKTLAGWQHVSQPLSGIRKCYEPRDAAAEESDSALYARVMELVDVLDSKSSAARRVGSSPTMGTIVAPQLGG